MIVILGGSGFIGRNLVNECILKGIKVLLLLRKGLELDLCQYDDVNCIYTDFSSEDFSLLNNASVLVNLIGVSNSKKCQDFPKEAFEINGFFLLKVMIYLKNNPKTKLIHISTSEVYGNVDYLPIDESQKKSPSSIYGQSKSIGEELVLSYAYRYDLDVTILRLFNVFGQGQSDSTIISEIVASIKSNSTIVIRDGTIKRDFIYIKDVLRAIIKAFACKKGIRVINICSGLGIQLSEVANIAKICYASDVEVLDKKESLSSPREIVGSTAEAKKELKWTAIFDMGKAIKNMEKYEK